MNTNRLLLTICRLSAVLTVYLGCSAYAQEAPTPAEDRVIVGQLLLPAEDGPRGMHVIIDVAQGETISRQWLKLDGDSKFHSSFKGAPQQLEIATGLAHVVHRMGAQELARLTKQDTVDIGTIDLRTRLQSHKITMRSETATTLRAGMWFAAPATDFAGNLPSLGSRQFPEIAAGVEMNWLIPSQFEIVYLLVEEPADERRGREWRGGKQKLFGPYRPLELPHELTME